MPWWGLGMSVTLPDDALDAVRWLAHGALRARRWDLAHDLLLGCVTAAPGDRWATIELAKVAIARGDLRFAGEVVRFARQRHPVEPEVRVLEARMALARGNRVEALGCLQGVDTATARALRARLS